MKTHPDFESLDFFDADIFAVTKGPAGRLTVDARNVLDVATGESAACRLVFDGVTSSIRRICEYRSPSGGGFLPPRTIEDMAPEPPGPTCRDYVLEGRLLEPHAWIEEWRITATACQVRVL